MLNLSLTKKLSFSVLLGFLSAKQGYASSRTCWAKATFIPRDAFELGYGNEEIRWIGVRSSIDKSQDKERLKEALELADKWLRGMRMGSRYSESMSCEDESCKEDDQGRTRTWCY